MDVERRALISLLNTQMCNKVLKQTVMRISKNSDFADSVRKQGNDMFQNKIHHSQVHEDIWKFYSMSIAVAELNSEALALAYGNRSVILLHLEKYEACIRDVDRAIKITKNKPFMIKLLCRKARCLHAMASEECKYPIAVAEVMLEKLDDNTMKKTLAELIKKNKLILDEPFKPQDNAKDRKTQMLEDLYAKYKVNDFSAVEIQHNEKYGRHLIATRDIKPGEVIYVEEPYTRFLNIKKLHAYCSHCFKTTWSNIPCDHCSWTMFCSEECKKDAWSKYHDIECPVYGCAKADLNDSYKQLAIRCLILSIKEAGSVEKLKSELQAFDECADQNKGFVRDGKIQSLGFKSIYALSKNIADNTLKTHLDNTAIVMRSLIKNTSFFGQASDFPSSKSLKKSDDAVFLGSLFLRLSKIAQLNQHQMWNANNECRMDLRRLQCWQNECCSRGVYLAPITSLLNHSCDPNARRCYSNDHKVILFAIKPIKKGSQIFDCYQEEFYERNKVERIEELTKTYNFECDCKACQNNWPHLLAIAKNWRNNIKDKPMEMLLSLEYKDLIPKTAYPGEIFDIKDLHHVAEGLDKSLVVLDQPSFLSTNLTITLNTIFERLYGINLNVPHACHNP